MTKEEFIWVMTSLGAESRETKDWIRFAKKVCPHNKSHRERIYDAVAARTKGNLRVVL